LICRRTHRATSRLMSKFWLAPANDARRHPVDDRAQTSSAAKPLTTFTANFGFYLRRRSNKRRQRSAAWRRCASAEHVGKPLTRQFGIPALCYPSRRTQNLLRSSFRPLTFLDGTGERFCPSPWNSDPDIKGFGSNFCLSNSRSGSCCDLFARSWNLLDRRFDRPQG
jgi:hypothetical protein